jgi:tetratricopeptide (TPR) repeat protein
VDIQQQAAQLSVQLQRLDQAERFFKTVLEKDSNNSTAHFGLGVIALQQRQWAVAREQFEWLAKKPQYQSIAFYYLGQLHQSLGERDKALAYYQKVKQGKFRVEAQVQQAFLQKQKEGAEAIIQALDAILVKTKEEKAHVWRAKAQVWQQAGKMDEAIQAYQQVIKIEPNDVPTLYKLSALLYDAKRYQQYEETLQKILKLSPNEADALNALGYFYLERGEDLSKSKPLLDRAYKLAPDRYYIIDSLGWWHHKAGDDAKAETLLRQALSLQLDEEVLAHLIEVEMALGKQDEAQQLWQKLKKHFPKSDKLNELVQKFGKKLSL